MPVDHPTIVEQLEGIPQVEDGVWDVCAKEREMGKVINAALYFYPSIRYPTTVSWNTQIQFSDGTIKTDGGVFRRWQDDSQIVCLRFDAGELSVDLFWDNNISVVPKGGKVS